MERRYTKYTKVTTRNNQFPQSPNLGCPYVLRQREVVGSEPVVQERNSQLQAVRRRPEKIQLNNERLKKAQRINTDYCLTLSRNGVFFKKKKKVYAAVYKRLWKDLKFGKTCY